MTTRAERRAQRERIKDRRIRRVSWVQDAAHAGTVRRVGSAVDTPTPCSCEMCGNPRRYFHDRTVQERRHGWN